MLISGAVDDNSWILLSMELWAAAIAPDFVDPVSQLRLAA